MLHFFMVAGTIFLLFQFSEGSCTGSCIYKKCEAPKGLIDKGETCFCHADYTDRCSGCPCDVQDNCVALNGALEYDFKCGVKWFKWGIIWIPRKVCFRFVKGKKCRCSGRAITKCVPKESNAPTAPYLQNSNYDGGFVVNKAQWDQRFLATNKRYGKRFTAVVYANGTVTNHRCVNCDEHATKSIGNGMNAV